MSRAEEDAAEAAYHARRDANRKAVQALINFKVDGMCPFGPSPADLVDVSLSRARSLTVLLSSHFQAADDQEGSPIGSLRHIFTAQAFEAVGTLISLALFAQEGSAA